ncbi:DNA topoisomerase I [Methyloceanibacter methanicus]|uniref:DNA topoisomerase 1 n=1 Tax=Methyloceanibacter methanicus TaxID=1774968 RepID=A0A1E3VYR0_9HYPH|nr:type I DNA topoisomerase [Methyloceanibacter methanicus]ODR98687.1 DNA topoisomerase I [Methyloceanibacter methanicus]
MNIVIVESPAKAKTINKYLGSDYRVLASYGHVRDLPSKNGSVLPDNDFEMHWDVDPKSAKRLNEIAQAVKGADKLILATDPDREGEAISWHVLQVLERKKLLGKIPVERVVFNAVTKDAIRDAMQNPRAIDEPLVNAYLARRALDYLVGFTLSPVLWRKLPGARSAGRVQSVALRLVCERELEIEKFVAQEYWSITASLATAKNETLAARLVSADGQKLGKFDVPDEETASALKAALEGGRYTVGNIESKSQKRNPAAPFTTSTLQQEASRKLGFSPRQTMQVAQRLYEGVDLGGMTEGLITYMRTDGVQIVPEAVSQVRALVSGLYGSRYVPSSPRQYSTKAKNAQEAHEAIRPTDFSKAPDEVSRYLQPDALKLYKLIWQRTLASQAASAEIERTTVDIDVAGSDGKPYGVRATGSVIRFDGFLKIYEEGVDDAVGEDGSLPALSQGESLDPRAVEAKQHFTEPPPRYSEATLIKKMEELGIGRPSTYAATLNVLREREYVRIDKKRLFPEDKGRLVTAFLESFFQRYVEYDFTADLEEKLDLISAGTLEWKDVLREFWRDFIGAVNDIGDLRIAQVLDALNDLLGPHIFPDTGDGNPRACPSCKDGQLSLKVGKFGAFVGCSNYPDCRYTRQLARRARKAAFADGKVLGLDPETGFEVSIRTGRFGPYIQLGEAEGSEKPKRASIPKGTDPDAIDLERALSLLSLPREVGIHPESGKPITAGYGRFGPYVQCDGKYASLSTPEEVFEVGANRAITLLAEKAAKGAQRGASVIKELGEHPEAGGKVQVLNGRYGPYVKHEKVNATIPGDRAPEDITLDDAVALIAARAAKGPAKKKAAKKAPAKKKAAKKTAAKKGTAKKPTRKSAPSKEAADEAAS